MINDYSVKTGIPWIFAGVVGSEAQTMTIVPGRTPCLRCIFDSPPPPEMNPKCDTVGVLGPIVSAIASIEATEAMKILAGKLDAISPYLLKFDLWSNSIQRLDVSRSCNNADCPCCGRREFDFLGDQT